MKKNVLALLMGAMVVATLVVGCGEKADTASNNAASDNAAPKTEETKTDDADDADADADDAEVEEEDGEIVVADISDAIAGTAWATDEGYIWGFDEDGTTFHALNPDLEESEGTYALAAATDGEVAAVAITIDVEGEQMTGYVVEVTDTTLTLNFDGAEIVLAAYEAE